jgi:hypothetical protein
LEEPSIDGRIILRWIFRNWAGRHCCKLVLQASTVTFNSTHFPSNKQAATTSKQKERKKENTFLLYQVCLQGNESLNSIYRGFLGKPEEKRPLGRPRQRGEHNIKMDLQEVGCRGIDWTKVA